MSVKHPLSIFRFLSKNFELKGFKLPLNFLSTFKYQTMKNALFYTLFIFLTLFSHVHCQSVKTATKNDKIKGITLVAPHRPFQNAAMQEVQVAKSQWIAIVPYGFTRMGTPSLRYEGNGWQDWGESYAGVNVTIDSAHKAGLKVMLKPQVWVGGGWVGGLDFMTDAEWEKWETDYEKYCCALALNLKLVSSNGRNFGVI
jgi:hypothetical protein